MDKDTASGEKHPSDNRPSNLANTPAADLNGRWSFVLNPVIAEVRLPFEISPGFVLDRATEEQRSQIKGAISGFFGSPSYPDLANFWERELIEEPIDNGGVRLSTVDLPPEKWRYYVVTSPADSLAAHAFHLCSNITDVPLELSALYFQPNVRGYRGDLLYHMIKNDLPPPAKVLDVATLNELGTTYQNYIGNVKGQNPSKFPELERAMHLRHAKFLAYEPTGIPRHRLVRHYRALGNS